MVILSTNEDLADVKKRKLMLRNHINGVLKIRSFLSYHGRHSPNIYPNINAAIKTVIFDWNISHSYDLE